MEFEIKAPGRSISATDLSSIQFSEQDLVSSVLQNIALILTTPKGSVPIYRNFGFPFDVLDLPMPVAKTLIIAAVKEAIETWEPRARFSGITFSESVLAPGELNASVEVEIIGPQS